MTQDIGLGGCAALEDGIILARCIAEALTKTGDDDEDRAVFERIKMGLNKFGKERRWRSFELISTSYRVESLRATGFALTSWSSKARRALDAVNSVVAKWLGFKEPAFVGRYEMRGYADYTGSHGLKPKFLQFNRKGFQCGFLPCDES
ncbi:hypothetical protein LWI29_037582 [Acer saccharum]|uniref:Uncharacterized protein n=1 Tax=Acer saccharum TaxID=4024 RepID=A0AA39S3J9_ACESA|nr:hypothetical protein LWI29_037582 [Acer saccharum]